MSLRQFTVRSSRTQEMLDITQHVAGQVERLDCTAVMVYVPHTTAGVLINEHADPAVADDILEALARLVPTNRQYRHAEGNAPAHVKASLVGTSQLIPVSSGRLELGTWQGIFLAEFDGPRTRTVCVVPVSA